MPCYTPLSGYYSKDLTKNGKRSVVFNRNFGLVDRPATVPCGQCIGCRLERSRQWAIRCIHEASLHSDNCFITLTYNDEHLPADRSLNLRHFQLFMKRFRKFFGGRKIRFFHCGEYGDKYRRPHYHAIVFGLDFVDKKLFSVVNGNRLYVSQTLDSLWGFGYATIGNVTFESAAYVARYVVKKRTGKQASDHYKSVDTDTGEVFDLKPEYVTMSRRPGIAFGWFDKYYSDVFPSDHVVVRGKESKPPKYYDKLYEAYFPSDFKSIKNRRVVAAESNPDNNFDRLQTKHELRKIKSKLLVRPLESMI